MKLVVNVVVGLAVIGVVAGGVLWWMNANALDRNVRACLELNDRITGNSHQVDMTEVVYTEPLKSYTDGTASYRVLYKVSGFDNSIETRCVW